MTKISAVILNFNGVDNSIECVNSLMKNKGEELDVSIVLVDNASKDGSVDRLQKEFGKKITIIENNKNLGFTGGSNEGMRYAISSDSDFVLLLNNDTIVDHDLIKNLILAASDEAVGGVVPKIYFAKGFEFHDKYKKEDLGKVLWYAGGEMDWQNLIGKNVGVDEVDRGQFDIKQETELATGCCFLIKKSVLQKVGIFDDKFFLYYEDADLSERIKKAGYKIIYEPRAFLWHKNAQSSGGSGSGLQDYYITRNRLLFGGRYAPLRTKMALTRESLKIFVSGRPWQKKGVVDYYLKRFGRGSFPI